MTLFSLLFSIVMGIGSLGWGYAQAGFLQFARWILIFGAVWLIAVWQRWRWFAYIGLVFNFLAAALGLWVLNFTPGWMFAGAIGGLLVWDLTDFRYRLRFSASDEERRAVERRHLLRVTFLALLGLLLASLAMILKFQFNFEWALLLAIVAALGILQMAVWLRKRN
ncbi:MAG: hypothetical protein HYX49_05385 [Chloroflexi bacterium]|nr:hypothetical protein [Chloroflexota bacterium]